jgi:putative Holliday junction resolvase
MKALGLDVGERRIGLAAGDSSSGLAVPAGVIVRKGGEADFAAVTDAAEDRQADTVVVGMPLSMNGRRGPQAEVTQEFVNALADRTALTIRTWDERLTSVEADRRLRERGGTRKVGAQDAMAAAIMLQAFMDAERRA